jgi:hypothetical protein
VTSLQHSYSVKIFYFCIIVLKMDFLLRRASWGSPSLLSHCVNLGFEQMGNSGALVCSRCSSKVPDGVLLPLKIVSVTAGKFWGDKRAIDH